MFKPFIFIAKTAPLADFEKFGKYYSRLPEERKKKTDSFKRHEDKFESVAAFALLQKALEDLGECPKDIRLKYGENQKPYLDNKNIYFNLSHSDGAAACVISPFEIGCDIESLTGDHMMIAKKRFCPREYELLLNSENEEAMKKIFGRLWTIKESVLKALGTGLTLPLNSFCVDLNSDELTVRSDIINETLYYREYEAFEGFSLSCASKCREALPLNVRIIEL